MEAEAQAEPEGSLSYDEVKDICLAWLVCVNTLKAAKWVPSFVGRSDVYVTNKMGGLIQKNRKFGAEFYLNEDGAEHCWGSTSCTTTTIKFDLKNLSFAASCD